MATYDGPADVLGMGDAPLERVRAELWCLNGGSDAVWGGVLYPDTERFHSGLEQKRGQSIRLRLPSGHDAHCQIEKVRAVAPQLVRVEGVSAPPFE